MKRKIEEILYKHSERVGLYEGGVITCVDENEFDEIVQEIAKLFAIPRVIKSVCPYCQGEPTTINTVRYFFCEKCKKVGQTVL